SPAMTQLGVILGTAAYMSPEQAKGKVADRRSDLWAFGCVLFEMLSGRRVFAADDVSETLAYVITRQPDWNGLPAATPSGIRTLLRRCLEKDRKRRLADASDARLEIDDALVAPPAEVPAGKTAAPTSRRAAALAMIGLVLGALLASAAMWTLRPAPST